MPVHGHGRRTLSDGRVVTRYLCPEGGGHTFSVRSDLPPGATVGRRAKGTPKKEPSSGRGLRTAVGDPVCPNPKHADGRVTAWGYRTDGLGTWQRWVCARPNGARHTFVTLLAGAGSVLIPSAVVPPCPVPEHAAHPDTRVVRAGRQGRHPPDETRSKTSEVKKMPAERRQRYQCHPGDGSKPHRFVLPLAREAVTVGADTCPGCEELLSPHRGGQAVARGNRHSLRAVVQTLNDLSGGASYAQASTDLRARTVAALDHQRSHGWLDALDERTTLTLGDSATSSVSFAAKRSRNGWRLAADLTEQYSPVLFDHLTDRVKTREVRQRARNDAILTGDPHATLANPLTYVLDELPVVVHRRTKAQARHQTSRWHLLVVSEIRWEHPAGVPDTPFDLPPMRDPVLRLVRAYPGASQAAWRLVLDELAVRPDFLISDFGAAIRAAIAAHYPTGSVGHVPSFFHMARNIRAKLLEKPGAYVLHNGDKQVVEELEKCLDGLTRADLVAGGPSGWAAWWDDFLTTLHGLRVPLASFHAQRDLYQPTVAAAFPLLTANPHLPASNAAVESKIRLKLEPLLENRQQRFRNIGRVNALMDLAVCRDQGLFRDLDAVARLIRASNDAAGGWAPHARDICDIHPPRRTGTPSPATGTPVLFPYSSLLDPYLTDALAKQRLTQQPTAAQTAVVGS